MTQAVTFWLVAALAAQFDMAAMQKWQSASVVRYRIVGEFTGITPLATTYAGIEVRDRVTIEADWDVQAEVVVGKATFTNTPTQVIRTTAGSTGCPAPTTDGAFEYMTVTAVVPGSAGLEVKGTRSFPAANVALDSPATCAPKPVAARTEAVSSTLVMVSPMMLAVPTSANPNMSVSADRKSFILELDDWTWTYTPTLVK